MASSRASSSTSAGKPWRSLLEQAARVADKFLVSAASSSPRWAIPPRARIAKRRSRTPTAPSRNYLIALLVNGSSAPARSEIVAGALKNHDRAVVIGETTFGKGSVQLVFTELPDRAALKLTIAQYLTEPGDISIQGTGVTPDIEFDPMTADMQEMDLTVDTGTLLKERDLRAERCRTRASRKARSRKRWSATTSPSRSVASSASVAVTRTRSSGTTSRPGDLPVTFAQRPRR